jgi:hypothetical protein
MGLGEGVMRREDSICERDIGYVLANGVDTGIECARSPGQAEAPPLRRR